MSILDNDPYKIQYKLVHSESKAIHSISPYNPISQTTHQPLSSKQSLNGQNNNSISSVPLRKGTMIRSSSQSLKRIIDGNELIMPVNMPGVESPVVGGEMANVNKTVYPTYGGSRRMNSVGVDSGREGGRMESVKILPVMGDACKVRNPEISKSLLEQNHNHQRPFHSANLPQGPAQPICDLNEYQTSSEGKDSKPPLHQPKTHPGLFSALRKRHLNISLQGSDQALRTESNKQHAPSTIPKRTINPLILNRRSTNILDKGESARASQTEVRLTEDDMPNIDLGLYSMAEMKSIVTNKLPQRSVKSRSGANCEVAVSNSVEIKESDTDCDNFIQRELNKLEPFSELMLPPGESIVDSLVITKPVHIVGYREERVETERSDDGGFQPSVLRVRGTITVKLPPENSTKVSLLGDNKRISNYEQRNGYFYAKKLDKTSFIVHIPKERVVFSSLTIIFDKELKDPIPQSLSLFTLTTEDSLSFEACTILCDKSSLPLSSTHCKYQVVAAQTSRDILTSTDEHIRQGVIEINSTLFSSFDSLYCNGRGNRHVVVLNRCQVKEFGSEVVVVCPAVPVCIESSVFMECKGKVIRIMATSPHRVHHELPHSVTDMPCLPNFQSDYLSSLRSFNMVQDIIRESYKFTEAFFYIRNTDFINNHGICISLEAGGVPDPNLMSSTPSFSRSNRVLIKECCFKSNFQSAARLEYSDSLVDVAFVNCRFSDNDTEILDIASIYSGKTIIQSCKFLNNTNYLLNLNRPESSLPTTASKSVKPGGLIFCNTVCQHNIHGIQFCYPSKTTASNPPECQSPTHQIPSGKKPQMSRKCNSSSESTTVQKITEGAGSPNSPECATKDGEYEIYMCRNRFEGFKECALNISCNFVVRVNLYLNIFVENNIGLKIDSRSQSANSEIDVPALNEFEQNLLQSSNRVDASSFHKPTLDRQLKDGAIPFIMPTKKFPAHNVRMAMRREPQMELSSWGNDYFGSTLYGVVILGHGFRAELKSDIFKNNIAGDILYNSEPFPPIELVIAPDNKNASDSKVIVNGRLQKASSNGQCTLI